MKNKSECFLGSAAACSSIAYLRGHRDSKSLLSLFNTVITKDG